ncbi:MAG: aminotransferase class I/II-fold pyridoxal phosphate-dependent enzyme [Candidatus Kapabacteria bacterium]|nr:aminotransferase class I/II-fold pyridoxal phosphate-dependent enzyme [Candidatus Kapabacteria bacterium]
MLNSNLIPARKTENITYAIRDIIVLANEVAKTGKEMLYLNIGDPNIYDFATPLPIVNSVHQAMIENKNGYSPSSGIPDAISAIERDAERKGINNILDIFITTGASEAIEICLTALLNPGDNFLMPTPGYPLYTAIQSKLECEPNPYYLDESNGWQPDVEDIAAKINDRTKAIVLINPNNPTGSVYSEDTLRKIINVALEHNLLIIADEIYDKLIFSGKKHCALASLNEDVSCITFSGLSKNYIAPGFRIGWGIASGRREIMKDYLEAVNKILRSRLCANHPIQYAITTALDGDQSHLDDMVSRIERRATICYNMLSKIPGISLVKPEGAFYAFPRIDVADDELFVKELLKETGVVVVPGHGFGQKPGTRHIRLVILPPEEILIKAFERIGNFYLNYKSK